MGKAGYPRTARQYRDEKAGNGLCYRRRQQIHACAERSLSRVYVRDSVLGVCVRSSRGKTQLDGERMKILITGNMGYVGPSVAKRLRGSYPGATLVGFDMGFFGNCLTAAEV